MLGLALKRARPWLCPRASDGRCKSGSLGTKGCGASAPKAASSAREDSPRRRGARDEAVSDKGN